MKPERKELIKVVLIVIVYTVIALVLWKIIQNCLTKEFFSDFLSQTGFLAPLVMLVIQILQVIIAPIPVQPVSIASGYIFGALWGFVIAYSGLLIGSFIAFYLGKTFGRPLVKRVVGKRTMNKYDGYIQKVSVFVLTIIYFLPLFPDDEITYILGMSKTKLKKLSLPLLLGKTGGASTAIIGVGLQKYPQYTFHMIFLAIIVTVLFIYYRHTLERWFNKIIGRVKK